MTHRERILMTVAHQRPDRVPTVYSARGETDRAVMAYYGVNTLQEVFEIWGQGGWAGAGPEVRYPGWDDKPKSVQEGDWPYAGAPMYWHDERTFEDQWGTVRRIGRDRKYVQWIDGPLAGLDDPDDHQFPTPDDVLPSPDLARQVQQLKDAGNVVMVGVQTAYKLAWELRGMQQWLMDYLINPGFVEKVYDKLYALWAEIGRRAVTAGVDIFGIGGDFAMQDRIIMGADTWRRFDKPRLAALFSELRAINPDLLFYQHCDGSLMEIMDDMVEIGFDVINPIQPECMDPFEVKRRWGDKITLHGCVSLQRVLPFGTPAEVRRHIIELIERCGYNGGLVLSTNVIGFDVPVQNVVTYFETARDYRFAD